MAPKTLLALSDDGKTKEEGDLKCEAPMCHMDGRPPFEMKFNRRLGAAGLRTGRFLRNGLEAFAISHLKSRQEC